MTTKWPPIRRSCIDCQVAREPARLREALRHLDDRVAEIHAAVPSPFDIYKLEKRKERLAAPPPAPAPAPEPKLKRRRARRRVLRGRQQ
jgi:hypothetical protein